MTNIIGKFNDTIFIRQNALSKEFCKSLINIFDKNYDNGKTFKGNTINGYEPDKKFTNEFSLNKLYSKHINKLKDITHSLLLNYTSQWNNPNMDNNETTTSFVWKQKYLNRDNYFYSNWRIKKYEKGVGHFKHWHVDETPSGYSWYDLNSGDECKPGSTLNCQRVERMFVAQYYLNDVKEGGETQFLYSNFKVKPEMGTVVIWPTVWPWVHNGEIPISSDKYIITGWPMCDPQLRINKIHNNDYNKKTKPVVKSR